MLTLANVLGAIILITILEHYFSKSALYGHGTHLMKSFKFSLLCSLGLATATSFHSIAQVQEN